METDTTNEKTDAIAPYLTISLILLKPRLILTISNAAIYIPLMLLAKLTENANMKTSCLKTIVLNAKYAKVLPQLLSRKWLRPRFTKINAKLFGRGREK